MSCSHCCGAYFRISRIAKETIELRREIFCKCKPGYFSCPGKFEFKRLSVGRKRGKESREGRESREEKVGRKNPGGKNPGRKSREGKSGGRSRWEGKSAGGKKSRGRKVARDLPAGEKESVGGKSHVHLSAFVGGCPFFI